ncbi:MAG: hypothetical protein MRY74_11520 [Neomegalonema sp.]|nr:hypothetical protein [Neomegalonema sp.]
MMTLPSSRNTSGIAPCRFAAAALAAFLGLTGIAAAQSATASDEDAKRYKDCMALIRKDATKALEAAAKWRAIGGGALARHCGAIAMIATDAELNAARELTELGVSGGVGFTESDRAAALSLAGDLWLRLEQPKLALKAFAASTKLGKDNRRIQLGSARAHAMLGEWKSAIGYLDLMIGAEQSDVEALTLRAAARRSAGDAKGALADAKKATEFAPKVALAWFERGAAERALGDRAAARKSWLTASLLDPAKDEKGRPGGVAGELARRNLERDSFAK